MYTERKKKKEKTHSFVVVVVCFVFVCQFPAGRRPNWLIKKTNHIESFHRSRRRPVTPAPARAMNST